MYANPATSIVIRPHNLGYWVFSIFHLYRDRLSLFHSKVLFRRRISCFQFWCSDEANNSRYRFSLRSLNFSVVAMTIITKPVSEKKAEKLAPLVDNDQLANAVSSYQHWILIRCLFCNAVMNVQKLVH